MLSFDFELQCRHIILLVCDWLFLQVWVILSINSFSVFKWFGVFDFVMIMIPRHLIYYNLL